MVLSVHDACGNSNGCTFTVAVRRPVLGPLTITNVSPGNVQLTWTDGILQSTTDLLVPFADIVPLATSPYPVSTVPPPVATFYRLRCTAP